MKAKIYQFPQGAEKEQVRLQAARNRNARAQAADSRKRFLSELFLKLFFFLRVLIAVVADTALTLVVTVCRAFVYLSILLGSAFLIIKYNTNGGTWDQGMFFCAGIMILGLLEPSHVSEWHLFKRLLCVYSAS